MRNNFPFFTLGVIITPILGFIAYFLTVYSESAPHIALYIFPWAYIGNFFHIGLPSGFLILGFLQFPVYGLLFDVVKGKTRRVILTIAIIASHLLLIMLLQGAD